MVDEIMTLRQQVAVLREQIGRLQVEREEMKRTYDAALERANRRVAELEAQHQDWDAKVIRGRITRGFEYCVEIDGEIAALDGGKEEEKVSEIPQTCDVCGYKGGYSTLVCGSCLNEMRAAIDRGKGQEK